MQKKKYIRMQNTFSCRPLQSFPLAVGCIKSNSGRSRFAGAMSADWSAGDGRTQMHDVRGAGPRRACELAIPPVRRHPLRWWTESLTHCPAPAAEHAQFDVAPPAQRCPVTASMRVSPDRTKGRRATRRARRRCHLDWGCGRRCFVLAVLALALSTALPRADGYLKTYATWCGDGICEPRLENRGWCPRDCSCGDGVCDDVEAASASCPKDCIKEAAIVVQPSPESQAGVAFERQPAVRLSDIAQLDAYTPGENDWHSPVVPHG